MKVLRSYSQDDALGWPTIEHIDLNYFICLTRLPMHKATNKTTYEDKVQQKVLESTEILQPCHFSPQG